MNYKLELTTSNPDATIFLLDGHEHQIGESVLAPDRSGHELQTERPRGLYIARVGQAHDFVETPIRLDRDLRLHLDAPPTFSLIPIAGAKSSHEYLTYALQDLTSRETSGLESAILSPGATASRLVLFIQGEAASHPAAGIQLLDAQGNVSPLRNLQGALRDEEHATWGASIAADPDERLRLYVADFDLIMPVDFAPRFQTVVLAKWQGGQLLPEATRMFFWPLDQSFDPFDDSLQVLERALDSIYADTPEDLPASVVNWILQPRPDRPSITMVCLFLLLMRDQADALAVQRLLDQLRLDLPANQPDLNAFEHLARQRLPGGPIPPPLDAPPTLRCLWDTLCAWPEVPAAWRHAHPGRHTDVPFSTWRHSTLKNSTAPATPPIKEAAPSKTVIQGGGIRAGKMTAINVVDGLQVTGHELGETSDISELAKNFEVSGGGIEAEEMVAANVVSGMQILGHSADDFRVELSRLHNRARQAAELGDHKLSGLADTLNQLRQHLGDKPDALSEDLAATAGQLLDDSDLARRIKALAIAAKQREP